MKRIGVLTGGGDCPGLNAVIRAVVTRAINTYHVEVLGIREGWSGLVNGNVEPLTHYSVTGILPRGGTILKTSRTNPLKDEETSQRLLNNIKKYGIDGLIVIGGEDTLGVAQRLHPMGVPVVGVPKTIDNDLPCTDYTFGFDTAVSIVTEAIDRLHTTAESHHRVMVIEVMGRHTGWIATIAGIAGGADCILIPEKPVNISKEQDQADALGLSVRLGACPLAIKFFPCILYQAVRRVCNMNLLLRDLMNDYKMVLLPMCNAWQGRFFGQLIKAQPHSHRTKPY